MTTRRTFLAGLLGSAFLTPAVAALRPLTAPPIRIIRTADSSMEIVTPAGRFLFTLNGAGQWIWANGPPGLATDPMHIYYSTGHGELC